MAHISSAHEAVFTNARFAAISAQICCPVIPHLVGCQRFLSIEPLLEDVGILDLSGIHWVIVGGESGRGARPMREEWVVSIREQCERTDVAFFFKQWGGVHKSKAGRLLEGRTYDEMPVVRRNSIRVA